MAREKGYYSIRTGKVPEPTLDLDRLKDMFGRFFDQLSEDDYLEESFGISSRYNEMIGTLGPHINDVIYMTAGKDHLWPVWNHLAGYNEDDLFDLIEFLYDHVSHVTRLNPGNETYDKGRAQALLRKLTNPLLEKYEQGFVLSEDGEIRALPDPGMGDLEDAPLPPFEKKTVDERVEAARLMFRRRGASLDERKAALIELAGVLEVLRPKIKEHMLGKDEAAFFNIANNFSLRHNRPGQYTDYDKNVWYSWTYYLYLSTIHAMVRVLKKQDGQG